VDLAVLRRSDMQWGNLGYGILNQYYGQGFGTEAAKAGLEIGFRFLGFHRLEAVINMDNLRSNRLAKSIGMKQEGKRRAFIFENGKWQDHRVYAAIPEGRWGFVRAVRGSVTSNYIFPTPVVILTKQSVPSADSSDLT
jgi:hypothetical protein